MKPPVYSSFTVTMNPSGRQFNTLPEQSLLESGLSAGIGLPFGCANGSCGACRARIVAGQIKKIRHHDYSLTAAQKLDGQCLLCSTAAISNVSIEVQEAMSVSDIAQQELQAKLCRVEQKDTMMIVAFKFVRGKALRFLPGQRAKVVLANGDQLALPIASCPCNAQYVEFHLSTNDMQCAVTNRLAKKLRSAPTTRERVTIIGPFGNFTLSNAVLKPKLFIAHGQGFAQLQGIIEQVLNSDDCPSSCLLWKEQHNIAHYQSNLCRSWRDAFDEFCYTPIKSNANTLEQIPDAWQEQLPLCEVYLDCYDQALIQQLALLGVDHSAVYYPDQTDQ